MAMIRVTPRVLKNDAKACTGFLCRGATAPPGKNCPVYGYCAVNSLEGQKKVAPSESRLACTALLDQRRDFVVLRIDNDDLVVLDHEGMRLDLRNFRRDFDWHRLQRDTRRHRVTNLGGHLV